MLKNGATEDVIEFATETLNEIRTTVLGAIINGSNTDQDLVLTTHSRFETILKELEVGTKEVLSAHFEERDFSRKHKECRGSHTEGAKPCLTLASCRSAAESLGLQLGGCNFDFEGTYSTVGCYSYSSGECQGMAFYGFRPDGTEPTDESDLIPSILTHERYRVPGTHDCQQAGTEKGLCYEKRQCDYELWHRWTTFTQEEQELRDYSALINAHFCVKDEEGFWIANGTTFKFRDHAVSLFPQWIDQKPVVDAADEHYDKQVPVCESAFHALDDKTDKCDVLQSDLDRAACDHYNKVNDVLNTFSASWVSASENYQQLMAEVHCLEIDRWKEWRTLASVQCLLNATAERNGRPCEESSNEAATVVATCEQIQSNADIEHLRINYPDVPARPYPCTVPWEIPATTQELGRCLPVQPHRVCETEYVAAEHGGLWQPPQPTFGEDNSHCNPRPDCLTCLPDALTVVCESLLSHDLVFEYPTSETECSQATVDQLAGGSFSHNGVWMFHQPKQMD